MGKNELKSRENSKTHDPENDSFDERDDREMHGRVAVTHVDGQAGDVREEACEYDKQLSERASKETQPEFERRFQTDLQHPTSPKDSAESFQ